MGALDAHAARVAAGRTVTFRPTGSSMVPLIRSRQEVTVAPADPAALETGDIVLARVAGTTYLHLVSALDPTSRRIQISNNRGRVNGWTSYARVYGICTSVDGSPRPRTAGKTVSGDGGAGASGPASPGTFSPNPPFDGPTPAPPSRTSRRTSPARE
jgi:hypothetical protein